MKITEVAVQHPVTTFMVFLGLSLIGVVSLLGLELDLFPDVTYPTAAVFTVYPGVGPLEVESGVAKPIENALSTLNGVKQISSSSNEGICIVIINFNWGTNMDTIVSEIREKLIEVEDSLPEGAERPMIFRFNPEQLPSLVFTFSTSTQGIDIRSLVEKEIVPELEKIEGVATADIHGGRIGAVTCKLRLDSIVKMEIPVIQILQVFQGENINLPGGIMSLENKQVVLRTIGEFKTLEDIGNVLVGYRDMVPLYLKDVAEIEFGFLPQEEYVRTGEGRGVQVRIRKQSGHNTVKVNKRILEKIEMLKKKLPPSLSVHIVSDQSTSILESIGGVSDAAIQGGFLAIFILLIFLRNIRSTLIVSIAIPVSIIATFSLMNFAHITMNMLSLMGITLGVGMFVDNAIVVLESIYRKRLTGLPPLKAAVVGTEEVSKAITASTLTTLVVFVPVVFVQGIAGIMFRDLSYTISFALAISLGMALTLIPVLCSRILKKEKSTAEGNNTEDTVGSYDTIDQELSLADVEVKTGNKFLDRAGRIIQLLLQKLDNNYEKAISWAIDHSIIIVSIALLLLVLSIGSVVLMGMEFLPEADEGKMSIDLETRIGLPYTKTEEKVIEMEKVIKQVLKDDLDALSSSIGYAGSSVGMGTAGSHLASIRINLVDKGKRDEDIWEIVQKLSRELKEKIVDAKITITIEGTSSIVATATGGTDALVIEVTGNNLDEMYTFSKKVASVAEKVPGTRDIKISHTEGKPELQFRIKRKEAVSLGISPLEIAVTIRTAYKGSSVSRFIKEENDYDVILLLDDKDRNDLNRISNLFVKNSAGTKIPIENVVEIVEGTGPLSISRTRRTRQMNVLGSLTGERPLNRVMDDIRNGVKQLGQPPSGIEVTYAGAADQMRSSFNDLFFALLIAAALVYMVMASQFESFRDPFIIFFSIPFGIVGVIIALALTGQTLSVVSYIGLIMLIGIVVNDGIVLISYIGILRRRGLDVYSAIIEGGRSRLRPVVCTSVTTILAMTPLALSRGEGAEIWVPFGITVIGGLFVATIITLVLMPTLYSVFEGRGRQKAAKVI